MQDEKNCLIELEKSLHLPAIRSQSEHLRKLLSADYFEFGSSGKIWKLQDVLERLPQEEGRWHIEGQDFEVRFLTPTIALITYLSIHTSDNEPKQEVLRSSLWERREALGWRLIFHQGTPKQNMT